MDSCSPLFSIIIPTYNRPEHLTSCLQSLTQLSYPCDQFEVIVVDDGSSDPLDTIVQPFLSSLKLNLIRQPNAGPAAARNRGAKAAQGQFIAFTDDDCRPEATWLKKLKHRFTENPNQIVGGHTHNLLPCNIFSTMSQNIVSIVYKHYNAIPYEARFFASNNMAIPTQDFLKIGGFNENFRTSEDREFCDRWLHTGRTMFYDPTIIIYHAHPMTLSQFWDQHFSYGQGAFYFHQTRAKRGSGKFKIEGNYYLKLLAYPFEEKQFLRMSSLVFVLLLSQVANTLGFFWEMWKNRHQSSNSNSIKV